MHCGLDRVQLLCQSKGPLQALPYCCSASVLTCASASYKVCVPVFAGAGWLDGFLIWPVAGADTDCTVADTSLDLDRLLSTASSSPAAEDRASLQQRGNPAVSRSLAEASTQRTKGSMGQHFCIHHGAVPVLLKPGSRPANVAGHQLPAPEDMEG